MTRPEPSMPCSTAATRTWTDTPPFMFMKKSNLEGIIPRNAFETPLNLKARTDQYTTIAAGETVTFCVFQLFHEGNYLKGI